VFSTSVVSHIRKWKEKRILQIFSNKKLTLTTTSSKLQQQQQQRRRCPPSPPRRSTFLTKSLSNVHFAMNHLQQKKDFLFISEFIKQSYPEVGNVVGMKNQVVEGLVGRRLKQQVGQKYITGKCTGPTCTTCLDQIRTSGLKKYDAEMTPIPNASKQSSLHKGNVGLPSKKSGIIAQLVIENFSVWKIDVDTGNQSNIGKKDFWQKKKKKRNPEINLKQLDFES